MDRFVKTPTGLEQNNESTNEVSEKKWAIISISSIPLVMTLGNSMLIPVLPTMEKKLSISSLQSSMIITVYSVVAIFLIPLAGYLSDRIGRKKVIIPSLFIAGIGGLISGFAAWKMENAYLVILLGRMLQGIGAAGAAPIVLPLVGDMFRRDSDVSSMLGVIETSNTMGKVLSPILGALLAGIIWFLPFFAIPVFCVISILLMLFLVKNPKKKEEDVLPFKRFIQKIRQIFADNGRWITAIFIIGGILMFVLFGVLFYLSGILEETYKVKDVKKGLLLAIPLGALCIASFTAGKLIKENKVLMKWVTFGGILLLGSSIALIGLSDKLWYLIIMFFISGVGIGVALPCLDAMITQGIAKDQRGTITSIYSSMRFIGVAAGPPVIALLMKGQEKWIFWGLSGLCVLAAILSFKAIRPEQEA
ncbi:MFS transporter [Bacillus aquiflavi]|uniref:MFS transporter n=1 Tax=Bacillus aquiflavi TaxID=2672567 RepID=A0A6B3W1A0_9BACI|nr:MFS transporter [Bacillus aquiflavi]MBA4537150.1 MFS transporter [Bacillus aquiflavi]NEY82425.1 MFS transporter [Bacillus aquiflavi]